MRILNLKCDRRLITESLLLEEKARKVKEKLKIQQTQAAIKLKVYVWLL